MSNKRRTVERDTLYRFLEKENFPRPLPEEKARREVQVGKLSTSGHRRAYKRLELY